MVEKKPLNHPAPDFAMYLADAFIFGLCRKSQGTHCLALAFCGAEGMRVLKSTQGLLATLRCRAIFLYPGTDTLSEWLEMD